MKSAGVAQQQSVGRTLQSPGRRSQVTSPAPRSTLYDRIPTGCTPTQRERTERELDRMACMMVHWFADRAFTRPDSLHGTIETYKGLVVANAHNGD